MEALSRKNCVIGFFLIIFAFDSTLFHNKCNGQWNRVKGKGIKNIEKKLMLLQSLYMRDLPKFPQNPDTDPNHMVRKNCNNISRGTEKVFIVNYSVQTNIVFNYYVYFKLFRPRIQQSKKESVKQSIIGVVVTE